MDPHPMSSHDIINTLPDECLANILSRVDANVLPFQEPFATVQHPIHCALVCKRWASVADLAVTHLNFHYGPYGRFSMIHASLARSLPHFAALSTFSVHYDCLDNLPSILQMLALGTCPCLETFEYLPNKGRSAERHLEIDGALLAEALRPCPRLRTIAIQVARVTHGAALNRALRELPLLERLDVAEKRWAQHQGRERALDGLHHVHEGLMHLKDLSIGHNCEGASLGPGVGALTLLEKLSLSCPYVTLPSSLGQLVNLTSLQLVGLYSLVSLPESLGGLRNLVKLKIGGCLDLVALPESLGALSALRALSLRLCYVMRGLPASIGRLSGLEKLTLRETAIRLPESVGMLGQLRELHVSFNRDSPIPDSIGNLQRLSALRLFGESPVERLECLGRLTNLRLLEIHMPLLTQLPESFGQLEALETLTLGNCELTALPDAIGQLAKLQRLSLFQWKKVPQLPECLRSLASLREVSISIVEGLGISSEVSDLHLVNAAIVGALQERGVRIDQVVYDEDHPAVIDVEWRSVLKYFLF